MLNNPGSARPNARGIRLIAASIAAGILLSLSGLAAVAYAADEPAAEDTIGISAAPASGDGSSSGRTRFSYQMSPGQTLDDEYVVSNTGTVAQTFTVFATDAFNTEEGGFGLLDTGLPASDSGSWVSFSGQPSVSLDLQPDESRSVPFTVVVPADATPGDHAGGLVVSVADSDGQVLVDRRVATRLYVRVPGELQPILSIDGMTSSYAPSLNPLAGETTVTMTVRNAGNVALAGAVKAEVKGLFGARLSDTVDVDVAEMLPGSTRTVTVVVGGVGQWLFLNPVVTIYPEIDAEALNPGPLLSVSRDSVLFVVPWVLVAALAIGLAVWGWRRWGRARDEKRAAAWIEYTETEARRKAAVERESVGAAAGSGSSDS